MQRDGHNMKIKLLKHALTSGVTRVLELFIPRKSINNKAS